MHWLLNAVDWITTLKLPSMVSTGQRVFEISGFQTRPYHKKTDRALHRKPGDGQARSIEESMEQNAVRKIARFAIKKSENQ